MRLRHLLFVPLSLCVFAGNVMAEPFGIHVLNATYTTDLSTRVKINEVWTVQAETTTSGLAITDDLHSSSGIFAQATAEAFSVLTSTSALWDISLNQTSAFAVAAAETVLLFSPVLDGTTTLTLDFLGTGQSSFSEGLVRLFDVSSGLVLWQYQWDYLTHPFEGNIPFACCSQAHLTIDQAFLASHQYAFTMRVGTDANTDSQSMRISTSGLYAVPEPSSLLLVGLGLVVTLGRRRYT